MNDWTRGGLEKYKQELDDFKNGKVNMVLIATLVKHEMSKISSKLIKKNLM